MIRNIFKVTLRHLWRQKTTSLINIGGLSIGLASSIIIFMFVFKEMSYDGYHKSGRNIYRVHQHAVEGGQVTDAAWTPLPLGPALMEEYPEVQSAVRIMQADHLLVSREQRFFNIPHALYVDTGFFGLFTFPLIKGEANKVLADPRSIVLTETLARKIFGNQDPVNEVIRFDNDTSYFRITGVCKDVPDESHFDCEMFISMDAFWRSQSTEWTANYVNTYLLLQDGYPYQQFEEKLQKVIQKYWEPQIRQAFGFGMDELAKKGMTFEYRLQPLKDIHFNTTMQQGLKQSGNRKYVRILTLIGIFIVLIAVTNFINLTTSQSTIRARESGLRIILGSSQIKLRLQYLVESVMICIFSLGCAILLIALSLPFFDRITGIRLATIDLLKYLPLALLAVILIGFFAGLYPSLVNTSVNTSAALSEKLKAGKSGSNLRSILVCVQFFIAIVILAGTMGIYFQMRLIRTSELGFDPNGILVIRQSNILKDHVHSFTEEIKKHPGIRNVTRSSDIPGFPISDNGFVVEGRDPSEVFVLYTTWVDSAYFKTFKMILKNGSDFSDDHIAPATSIILNESAVRKMRLENPVGMKLMKPDGTGNYDYYTIAGVVRDFHFKSLHSEIEPCAMLSIPEKADWVPCMSVRFDRGNTFACFQVVENTWKQFTGGKPMEYSFLDDELKSLYSHETQTGNLSAIFTFLAIVIACLGLLGMISFTTTQRIKEIGVRKILGASTWRIATFLSFKTLKLIIIASLFAWPVAYFFLKDWLQNFARKTDLNPLIFIAASAIILMVSMLTIGYHTWQAATRNPADSLKYE